MGRPLRLGVALGILLTMALVSSASINLNSSRSNIYRLWNHASILTKAQAKAMLDELDKLGPMGEAKLKLWLAANFKRFGIKPENVKKIVILEPPKAGRETAIILLSDPADEGPALAMAVQSGKSKSSD